MKRQTRIVLAIVVLLIIVGIVVAFRPAAIPVETAVTQRGLLQEFVEEEGKTRMHDHFVVAATVTGKLQRINLHAGDPVHAGDAVAWLEPAPIDPRETAMREARLNAALSAQKEADALVGSATAEHEQAAIELRRTQALFQQGITAKELLDKSSAREASTAKQLEAARSRAESAGHQVQEARSALISNHNDSTAPPVAVRSPVDGRVLKLLEQSERVLGSGTPILEIGYSPRMEAVADFLTRDVVRVSPGMDALITDWGGDKPLRARVRTVEPGGFTKISALGVEEQRANIVLDFLDLSDRLADGYRVEVRIITWQGQEVLKVPVSALFRSGDQWAVFTVGNRTAHKVPVQIGHRGEFEAEILSGLNPGEELIIHPSNDVKEGSRVSTALSNQQSALSP